MQTPVISHFSANLGALFLAFLLAGCISSRPPEPAVPAPPPPAVLALLEPVPDPLEGCNRSVQVFNQMLLTHLIRPFSQAYNFILPEFTRESITHASDNLGYPRRAVNCLLQGKYSASWDETRRFGVNSTVGILGLRDQASAWGIPRHNEDFGQTFAAYGWGEGFFFNLPLLGPSSGRDVLGRICDFPFDLAFWLFSGDTAMAVNGIRNGNQFAGQAEPLHRFFSSQYDSYPLTKTFHIWRRKAQAGDYQPPDCQGDPDQSFGYLLLQPRDPDYGLRRGRNRTVQVGNATSRMPYTCYPVKEARGIVVILPGLGGHRLSNGVTALAELLNSAQLSAIAISSSLAPDYFLHLPEAAPPGYFLPDCQQMALVLQAVLADFRQKYAAEAQPCSLLGFSLGALNTLYLADLIRQGGAGSLQFERYLAINPPKDVFAALQCIDTFFALPERWPEEEQQRWLEEIFLKLASVMQNDSALQDSRRSLPFSREESQFLIGLNMRLNLAEAMVASQKQLQQKWLVSDPAACNKNALWREALATSSLDYLQKSLLPFYQSSHAGQLTVATLRQQSDLAFLEKTLRDNERITVFHNRNDFLVNDQHLEWLQEILGNRARIFPEGGHLGNMYRHDYQAQILQVLTE
ncbi:MAG: VacJ family lipoprotein [Oligosphaeraceae bacterium]|nr:VacJ family lipoprotein [Oligosphaeraceae bacterium]